MTDPRQVLALRWKPTRDLFAVALSWPLVVGGLYTATVVVGPMVWGGMAYFAVYAILTALVFGLGVPLYWTTAVKSRPLGDLGITRLHLGKSLVLQAVLSVGLFLTAFRDVSFLALEAVTPLVALALPVGFFEVEPIASQRCIVHVGLAR